MKSTDDTGFRVWQIRVQVTDIQEFLKELRAIGKKHQCVMVCFNREVMAGFAHVKSAITHAERAITDGTAISRTTEVEALLYAAGTRQTGLIGPFGIHAGENECYLVISPDNEGAYADLSDRITSMDTEDWETIGPGKEQRLCSLFGITDAELVVTGKERIQDLVLERVALLAVNR